ncbi:hypothetical protein ON010_g11731 [Phytophthora cinnamomi]|nr:hypothetical protein ON010_g11731 [Phytophthora cinnamomi]
MHFNGYKYGVNTTRGNTTYYQCSTYRSNGCKGKLNVKVLDGGDTEVKDTGEHTCKSQPGPTVQDCGEEMRQLLDTEAVNSSAVIPSRLWEKLQRLHPSDVHASGGQDEWTYRHAFHWVQVLGKMQMTPGSITSDFKATLIKGLRDQFPGTSLIDCLFHWKQAIRRKLDDPRFPTNKIDEAMAPGVLDILTVTSIDGIRCKGIPYSVDATRIHCVQDAEVQKGKK